MITDRIKVIGSLLLLILIALEAPIAGTANNNCKGEYKDYRITNDAMMPLLEKGNYIKVYSKNVGPEYCFAIERGGIYTYISNTYVKDIYVHRIIGLPGDTIEQKGKSLIVNGTKIEQTFVAKFKIKTTEYETYKETIGEYEFNSVYKFPVSSSYDGQLTVPDGHYFFVGDNRDHSNDSRFIGNVPKSNIIGQVIAIYE